jgi:hypothetical protein
MNVIVPAAVLFVVGVICLLLVGAEEYPHRFAPGDCVQMKRGKQTAVVMSTALRNDIVIVRPDSDGPPIRDTLHVRDFELVACGSP